MGLVHISTAQEAFCVIVAFTTHFHDYLTLLSPCFTRTSLRALCVPHPQVENFSHILLAPFDVFFLSLCEM